MGNSIDVNRKLYVVLRIEAPALLIVDYMMFSNS